jgi:transposase-like protein
VSYLANRMMDLQVESLTGAAHGERSPARLNHRNGYRERTWGDACRHDRSGDPQAAEGQLLSGLPGAAAGREKALTAVIQEAYVHGVSPRSVDDLVKAVGMTGTSKSQVSRLCAEIDERVHAFLNHPIERFWPYL